MNTSGEVAEPQSESHTESHTESHGESHYGVFPACYEDPLLSIKQDDEDFA